MHLPANSPKPMIRDVAEWEELEANTGAVFQNLWGPYNDTLFQESVALFTRRLDTIGFDPLFFRGKACLDAGCGGGRNTIAMAQLGAREAIGIDVGAEGIHDARFRAAGLNNAHFRQASILDIPYEDEKFDVVWCAGVMMITHDEDRALDELTRVLKPGGLLYLLVYASGGLRWPLIQLLRPLAAHIGLPMMELAIERSGVAANKRRTFVDDLFCPTLDFYHWPRLRKMLESRGFADIRRWGPEARHDHEHSLEDYRKDMQSLAHIFSAGCDSSFGGAEPLFQRARDLTLATIETIAWFEFEVSQGRISQEVALETVVKQGHHRLFATKGS